MEKRIVTIVHCPSTEFEIIKESSVFAPKGMIFIVPPKGDFLQMARTIAEAEKAQAEWIRRYENVLTGLKYWRNKALEK